MIYEVELKGREILITKVRVEADTLDGIKDKALKKGSETPRDLWVERKVVEIGILWMKDLSPPAPVAKAPPEQMLLLPDDPYSM